MKWAGSQRNRAEGSTPLSRRGQIAGCGLQRGPDGGRLGRRGQGAPAAPAGRAGDDHRAASHPPGRRGGGGGERGGGDGDGATAAGRGRHAVVWRVEAEDAGSAAAGEDQTAGRGYAGAAVTTSHSLWWLLPCANHTAVHSRTSLLRKFCHFEYWQGFDSGRSTFVMPCPMTGT